jgi:hypothetical protein
MSPTHYILQTDLKRLEMYRSVNLPRLMLSLGPLLAKNIALSKALPAPLMAV